MNTFEQKLEYTKELIRCWYEAWDGQVYVSFSGGKDSTALLSIVRGLYPEVPAVFCHTGLEYPEILSFVKKQENITTIHPGLQFNKVIEKYGYPVISKEVSNKAYQYHASIRNGNKSVTQKILYGRKGDGAFKMPKKWMFLLDAPFKTTDECCRIMKKRPFARYEKESNRMPFIGTMISDSRLRKTMFKKYGCNAYRKKHPTSNPLAYWKEEDVWAYIKENNIEYSKIYDMGYDRTGCMFCMFGINLDGEPNRFQKMQKTHPKQYKFCMEKLGLKEVLQFIGVPYENKQFELWPE